MAHADPGALGPMGENAGDDDEVLRPPDDNEAAAAARRNRDGNNYIGADNAPVAQVEDENKNPMIAEEEDLNLEVNEEGRERFDNDSYENVSSTNVGSSSGSSSQNTSRGVSAMPSMEFASMSRSESQLGFSPAADGAGCSYSSDVRLRAHGSQQSETENVEQVPPGTAVDSQALIGRVSRLSTHIQDDRLLAEKTEEMEEDVQETMEGQELKSGAPKFKKPLKKKAKQQGAAASTSAAATSPEDETEGTVSIEDDSPEVETQPKVVAGANVVAAEIVATDISAKVIAEAKVSPSGAKRNLRRKSSSATEESAKSDDEDDSQSKPKKEKNK